MSYNTTIQTFPNLLAAGIFGFKEEELFEPKAGDTDDVVLKDS